MSGAGEVYYDSIAMFVFLLLAARYLQSAAQAKAVRAVERLAGSLQQSPNACPAFQRRVRRKRCGGAAACRRSCIGAGRSPIPADGCVVEGASRVDEAL